MNVNEKVIRAYARPRAIPVPRYLKKSINKAAHRLAIPYERLTRDRLLDECKRRIANGEAPEVISEYLQTLEGGK